MAADETSDRDPILRLLAASPGLKAKDIAGRLGIDKSDVNSRLYTDLSPYVVQDSAYRWYLLEDAPGTSGDGTAVDTGTPLGRLCAYYLECLTHDDTSGVQVFARDKYDNPDYAELDQWPLGIEAPTRVFEDKDVRRVVRKVQKDRYTKSLFLGYPVFLRHHRSQGGWEGFFVEPIFLFSYGLSTIHKQAPPSLEDRLPWLNIAALEHLPRETSESALYESIRLTQELGLDRADMEVGDFEEVALRLQALRPDWPWREALDPSDPVGEPHLPQLAEAGVYNRAVVVAAERSPYTRGLETELGKLRRASATTVEGTALGDWLGSDSPKPGAPEQHPLIEVLPLNSEQRQAVLQSLDNPLTIVTGPPGTGKSQVVTSILINATWRGQRVLFASKNNKAVDVVEERVNALGPRPVLLRLGRNEYQGRLAEYLSALLSASVDESDRGRYSEAMAELRGIQKQFQELEACIGSLVDLRNEVDGLEQEVEEARTLFTDEELKEIRGLETSELDDGVRETERTIAAAIRSEQRWHVRLLWPLYRKNRYGRVGRLRSKHGGLYAKLGASPPTGEVADGSIEGWAKFARDLCRRLDAAEKTQEYFSKLQDLTGAPPLERLQEEEYELVRAMSEASARVWTTWLALQPARLGTNERRLLGDYAAVLKMLVGGSEDGSSVGKEVYERYHKLFPKITQFLSCWAITSLTARRLPFEPAFFDLLVIDEASQCDIASALPLLFRAKRAVIIGDPKQLKHISGVGEKQDQGLLTKHDLIEEFARWAYSVTSLFDLASQLCRSEDVVNLRDHHRSHGDIIEFSNRQFYEGNLRLATQYDRLHVPKDDGAVRWKHVQGRVRRPGGGSAVNDEEATAVVNELDRLILEQGYPGSVGVVTPFRAQANRIRDLVQQDDDLTRALSGREFLPGTAHGFQGDERDLIIFSPVVAQGITKGALYFLQNNGYLFNVAITRARGGLVVVGDRNAALESGVDYLAAFARYVAEIDHRAASGATSAPQELGPEYPHVARPELVSDWEPPVYRALFAAGLRPLPQYEVDRFILDFALIDGDRKLDIEIDGERYHRRWDGELRRRDQLRNFRLIELGWDVMRFWVYQVRDDIEACVERVLEWKGDSVET